MPVKLPTIILVALFARENFIHLSQLTDASVTTAASIAETTDYISDVHLVNFRRLTFGHPEFPSSSKDVLSGYGSNSLYRRLVAR